MKLGAAPLWIGLVLAGAGAVRAEPQLLHEDASGVLELAGETRLLIDGLRGEIHVRGGERGKLRYEARTAADREIPQPVALWLDGGTLRLTSRSSEETAAVLIEIAVPPELDVTARLQQATFSARSLQGDLALSGAGLRAELGYLTGSIGLQLERSVLSVTETQEQLTVEGSAIEASLSFLRGPLAVDLRGGTLQLQNAMEGITGQIEGTAVRGEIIGRVELEASGGSVQVGQLLAGGKMKLSDTPLVLAPSRGAMELETDGSVDFIGQDNAIRILSYGGEIKGRDSKAEIDIEAHGGSVVLEKLGGPVTVKGDGTRLSIQESAAAVTVQLASSEVVVLQAAKALRVENEFGDITIHEAMEDVHVVSRDGTVRATGLAGPIDLRADGYDVEVSWVSVVGDSFVENAGGDVHASIPAGARCQVVANGASGVESQFDDVPVGPDGDSAAGSLNQGRSPKIELRSRSGFVYLGPADQ